VTDKRAKLPALFLLGASIASWHSAEADPARAAVPPPPRFDGVWIIDATTSGFLCPAKGKRVWAQVNDGRVTKFAGLPATVSGGIGADGAVSFTLKAYGVTATVRGKVNVETGVGDWSSNSLLCTRGNWRGYVVR
jgi:hypothetical protein